jgi:hypothetical protein
MQTKRIRHEEQQHQPRDEAIRRWRRPFAPLRMNSTPFRIYAYLVSHAYSAIFLTSLFGHSP